MKIKNLTLKNFLSVGAVTQAIDFSGQDLTLVLGSNLDLGGDDAGSKNGVGKSTMVNALSYALYGQALTKIKRENLINKINGKGMLVTVEFEKGGSNYRIERGRKPNVLKIFVNDQEQKSSNEDDDSQGDSRETQKAIEKLLEMSHTMFKHLVGLNTYTEPFLSMGANDQREVIEQLLGITLLSEKAENLKSVIKNTKDLIQQESFKIDGIKIANENVQKSIKSLELKSSAWEKKKQEDIAKLEKAIFELNSVNIDEEIQFHQDLKQWSADNLALSELVKQRGTLDSALGQSEKTLKKYIKSIETLSNHKCPACEQELHDHKHNDMLAKAQKDVNETQAYVDKITNDLADILSAIEHIGTLPRKPITFYDTEREALEHRTNLGNLEKNLANKQAEINPYLEQIYDLTHTALQEINWDSVNELTSSKDHQEFLLKLLTNKDSFIRKKIVDQNLAYLNKRLSYYIDQLGLPHQVVFQNDLSVLITQLGQELDFDNLSRGERNRLILSLSFSFRDVWENLYDPINVLFVDELIDSGLDGAGVEAGLSVLKKMVRDRNKNIFLISHKEELIGRVNNVLKVVKENGFTTYNMNSEE